MWNLKPFSLQRYFANTGGMLNSVVFSRESKRLGIRPQFDLKQSGDIEFWNLDHPDRWSETNANFFRDATALALSPDGKNIAITSRMRAVNLAFDNGKELSPLGKEWDGIKALVWSQDSTTLTTVQDERSATIKRWTPNGTETFSVEIEGGMRNFYDEDGNRSPDSGVFAISPDTKQVAGVRLKTKQTQLCLWNTTTGKVTQTFDLPAKQIKVMSFSPNAQLLVIGDEQGIVSIFDLKAKTQRVIEAHLERITALTWSPRGSRLVTNSADGKSKFWDTSSTRLLATLWVLKDSQAEGRIISDGVQQAEAPKWILFTPEGYYMASPQAEPYLRWRVGDQLLPATAFSTKFRNQKTVEKAIAEN